MLYCHSLPPTLIPCQLPSALACHHYPPLVCRRHPPLLSATATIIVDTLPSLVAIDGGDGGEATMITVVADNCSGWQQRTSGGQRWQSRADNNEQWMRAGVKQQQYQH
jgi:hypothetical protein